MQNDWQDRAACWGVDQNIFFDTGEPGWSEGHAKSICRTCPVAGHCAEAAIYYGEREGIWGGRNIKELNEVARRRGVPYGGRKPCGTNAGYATHIRKKEPICEACRIAHNERKREESKLARRLEQA